MQHLTVVEKSVAVQVVHHELLLELVGGLLALVERHVRVDALALDVVREADDRRLRAACSVWSPVFSLTRISDCFRRLFVRFSSSAPRELVLFLPRRPVLDG